MQMASEAERKAALGKNRDHKVAQNLARANSKIKKIQAQQNVRIFVKFALLICGFALRTVALTERTSST